MAQISRSVATLRISGDEVIPSDISERLKCAASYGQIKGETITGKNTGRKRIVKTGMWRLSANEKEPENLDAQIVEIFEKLTSDMSIWKNLSSKYDIDLFCGLFMEVSNEGMIILPSSLKLLGERGVQLSLDIYDGDDDPPDENHLCPCGSGKKYGECCKK